MQNNANTEISKGWETVRENWQVPPGVDREKIVSQITPVDEILSTFSKNIVIEDKPSREVFEALKLEGSEDLFDIELQHTAKIDRNTIIEETPDLKRHIRGLFKSMGSDEFKMSYNGRYLRANYKVLGGDDIDIIFDVKSEKSSKKDGIKIVAMYQTNDKGKILDINSLMPNGEIYYHKAHWLQYVINPALFAAVGSAGVEKISLRDAAFLDLNGIHSPAEVISHEAIHINTHSTYPEIMDKRVRFFLFRMLLASTTFTSLVFMVGVSPWFLLPALFAQVGSYMASRSSKNAIGEGYYANITDESISYMADEIVKDFLLRKGFNIVAPEEFDVVVNSYNSRSYAYQPLLWSGVDWIRSKSSGRKSNKELQPATV